MKKAIYAGSFDPVTFGHIDILKKATGLFDKVYVLVAHNPSKQHLLSIEDRIELMKDATSELKDVEVFRLPYGETVAHEAWKAGVTYLVRGLRGHTDLDDEMVNARINKEINSNLETVLFVTDINLEELSSTLVRGMVGLRDWKKMLEHKVLHVVIEKLEDRYFQNFTGFDDKAWSYIKSKLKRPYHNLRHSFDVFDQCYYDVQGELDKKAVLWASLYHDIDPSEQRSFELWRIGYCAHYDIESVSIVDRVHDLIIATDHSKQRTEKQLNDDTICKFIAADLMILASDYGKYCSYADNIRKEYSELLDDEFAEGRIEFLKQMLKRCKIFPGDYEKAESKARENMQKEILALKGY